MKPKNFDPDKMLDVIADTFARNGYEGTSLDVITKRTGLGKQSLYNAYGDKKALLMKTIQCAGRHSAAAEALRDQSLSGRERIEAFFEATLAEAADHTDPGCLITNLLLEKGATDMEVWKAASARWNQTRAALQSVVEIGVKDKSIHSRQDPEILSYALMNLLNGLRVTVRASNNLPKITKVIMVSLKSLL